MELDLTGQLERSAAAAVVSTSSAVMEESGEELRVELTLGRSYGEVGSRKRLRESDGAVEGKKTKMAEILHKVNPSYDKGPVSYGLQVMAVILQGPNGYGYPYVVPCLVPRSAEGLENGEYKPGRNRNLAVNMDGVVAGGYQPDVAVGYQPDVAVGLSSPGRSASGTCVFHTFSAKGESNNPTASASHSSSISVDNHSPISVFSNSQRELKKQPTDSTGPPRCASRMQTVSTRSAEGKKINGYLYLCSKNEVSIICDCHGSLFSPAGFVRHAGGPETQHPLRQITVVPS